MERFRLAILAAAVMLPAAAQGAAPACPNGWEVVDSPDPSHRGDNVLKAVAGRAGNDVWAVGQYAPDSNPNVLQTLTAHYDGIAWRSEPSPNVGAQANALVGLAVAPGGAAWAVGYYIDASTFFARSLIETWTGSRWQVVTHPDPGAAAHLFAVAAVAADDVWAVGETEPRISLPRTLILHFDGTAWSEVPSPNPGDAGNILYGVTALADNDAWAVGAQTNAPGPDRALVLHWDGTTWHVMRAPRDRTANSALYAVGFGAGGLLTVGEAQNDVAARTTALAEGGPFGIAIERTTDTKLGDDHLYGLAITPSGDWAVGSSIDWNGPGGGNDRTLIEYRGGPGDTWHIVRSPDPLHGGENQLGGIAEVDGTLWAVGDHDGRHNLRTLILRHCH